MKFLFVLIIMVSIQSCGNKDKALNSDCIENLKEDCMCTMDYNPVCGCNGKTYGNACSAECHGIFNYTQGECE